MVMGEDYPGFQEGWLWKWTNYVNGYQKRWFVLSRGVLSYYMRPEETAVGCRGNVILSSARWFRENQGNFRIEVDHSLTYYLKAANGTECDQWLSALDNENTKTTIARLAVQGLTTDDMLKAIVLPLEVKLTEVRNSCTANALQATSMISTLEEIEKEIELSQTLSRNGIMTKELKESVSRFRIASSSMLQSCTEFTDLLTRHVKGWQNTFQNSEMSATVPQSNANYLDEEETFEDATDLPLANGDGNGMIRSISSQINEYETQRRSNYALLLDSNHRKSIPHKPDYRLNLWSVLKYCIGRDISKLPVPVNFGEPISILQKLAEEMEYSELLDRAAMCVDPCMQLVYVAAFSVSCYSSTAYRTGKPFNPMLGETYELDCLEELGFRYVAEQVSHHPPKAATYAKSSKKSHGGWSHWQDVMPSSKFRGNYLTLTPIGASHVLFHDSGNHYTWNKVTISVNNIILGKLWFDQNGVSEIINHTTGDKCSLKYHPYTFSNPSKFRKVSGIVTDKKGLERYEISGFWDKEVRCKVINHSPNQSSTSEKEFVMWNVNPLPEQAESMYNFTALTMMLNEWDDSCSPTDSRRRPDQRKMEETLWDDANRIKLELEQRQRERRKVLETENIERKKKNMPPKEYQPLWFEKRKCPLTGENAYVYNHQYWNAKEQKEWTKCPDIFNISGPSRASSTKDNWPDLVQASRIRDSETEQGSNSNSESVSHSSVQ